MQHHEVRNCLKRVIWRDAVPPRSCFVAATSHKTVARGSPRGYPAPRIPAFQTVSQSYVALARRQPGRPNGQSTTIALQKRCGTRRVPGAVGIQCVLPRECDKEAPAHPGDAAAPCHRAAHQGASALDNSETHRKRWRPLREAAQESLRATVRAAPPMRQRRRARSPLPTTPRPPPRCAPSPALGDLDTHRKQWRPRRPLRHALRRPQDPPRSERRSRVESQRPLASGYPLGASHGDSLRQQGSMVLRFGAPTGTRRGSATPKPTPGRARL